MADAPMLNAEVRSGIGLLDIKDGQVFLHVRQDRRISGLHLLGHGDFREAPLEEVVSGVNLFADSDFTAPEPFWRTGNKNRELRPVEVAGEYSSVAPSSHRALKLSVQRSEPGESRRYFIPYDDPIWGKRTPVLQNSHYLFRLRAKSSKCSVGLRAEFFDNTGARLPDSNIDVRFPTDAASSLIDCARTLDAPIPPGAVSMSCVIVVTADGDMPVGTHVDAWFGEPMLWRRRTDGLATWRKRPEPFTGYYAALGNDRAKAFAAKLSRQGMIAGREALAVVGTGRDEPLLEISPDQLGIQPGASGQIVGLSGRSLTARARLYAGDVKLRIDGAEVGTASVAAGPSFTSVRFTIPDRYFDGEAHLVELVDQMTIHQLAVDYLIFPSIHTSWSTLARYAASPLPGEIDKRAGDRMRAMRAQFDYFAGRDALDGHDSWLVGNLGRIHEAVTRGFEDNRDNFALEFPEVAQPSVSIIIPAHNQYSVSFVCLCSLLLARNDSSFEVVVVDDGSTDRTAEELSRHKGLTVVTNPGALGFIGACKAGVEQARGDHLLFLNNDVEVTAGWIDELLKVFDIFSGTGAACSKLLFPNGQLQDAGGMVWRSGAPANYGRRQNPADPRFTYSRDADYLSGAALITPKAVWEEIGGFADELRPAYYEDTWYSFAVRELGLRTIYCALSVVYHAQGISNGTDVETETGLKRFQKINEPKFRRRWSGAFRDHGPEGVDADIQKDRRARGRVLVLDWSIPRPDNDAGSFAAVQEMRLFQGLGYKVTFFAVNLANLGSYTLDLNRLGIETITAPFAVDVAEFLDRRGDEFDIVLINRHNVGEPIVDTVRTHAPNAKVVLNVADLHFLREMRRALLIRDSEAEAEAHELREHELEVMRKFDLVLSYSDFEVGLMTALLGSDVAVDRMPWVQPVETDGVQPKRRRDLCFLGSHNHPPNTEAVSFFAIMVLPRLVGAKLHVYGSNWPEEAGLEFGDHVRVEGYVCDLGEMFARHRICVVPLRSGAGVKGKVLMAMAHGVPCILSPVAAEGLAVTDGKHCLIAETGDEWIEAVTRLQSDDALWKALSAEALTLIAERYSFEAGLARLTGVLEKLDIYA